MFFTSDLKRKTTAFYWLSKNNVKQSCQQIMSITFPSLKEANFFDRNSKLPEDSSGQVNNKMKIKSKKAKKKSSKKEFVINKRWKHLSVHDKINEKTTTSKTSQPDSTLQFHCGKISKGDYLPKQGMFISECVEEEYEYAGRRNTIQSLESESDTGIETAPNNKTWLETLTLLRKKGLEENSKIVRKKYCKLCSHTNMGNIYADEAYEDRYIRRTKYTSKIQL